MVSANREMVVYCFDTLLAHYNGEEAPPPAFDGGQHPLFVTWKKVVNGGEPRLRGCIGTLEARCLINGFKDYALNSALRDRRFPPIQPKELPHLECTVSILVDYEIAINYLDWEVGKHGIIIEFNDPDYNTRRSATYLPEVAAHEGWTKIEAIDSLVRKAGYNGAITESLRKRIRLTRYQRAAGWLSKYKIQAKNNSPAAQGKCISRLLLYHFGVNLPVMLVSYPVFKRMGMRSTLPLPSWKVVFGQIIFYFIIEDFVFYWGHRILHTKWLYKNVHSVHHEYATPFGLTSEYAHPAEILFLGFATIVGPALTGPHLFTLWLWMVVRVLETVEAHCGYHFPWSPSNFIPLYGGAYFHDYHHRLLYTKSGNYSSTFTYMDWIFGTDKGFRNLEAIKKAEN